MSSIDRRAFLKLGLAAGVAGVAGAAGLAGCTSDDPDLAVPPTPPTTSRVVRPTRADWPGHQPGRIYVGVASGGDLDGTLALTGPVGVHRTFHQWFDLPSEMAMVAADHAARRIPWVSFKPPKEPGAGAWASVAAGNHDKNLRRRARHYAKVDQPIIATFHHEPHNDEGTPAEFAAAWMRAHDVMKDETGLENVAFVPILGEWVWNERNPNSHPEAYLPNELLGRAAFLGIDVYQNRTGEAYAERLGPVLTWLDSRGFSRMMLGIGETASTDDFGDPTGAEWWSNSWAWAERNAARIGVLSYFNSTRNSSADWLLTQSPAKLDAFKSTLASPKTCLLA